MRVFDTSSIYLAVKRGSIGLLMNAYTLTLAKYEIGNAIWKQIRLKKALSPKEGEKVLRVFGKIFHEMEVIEPDYERVLKISTDLRVNYYDASYLQAAQKLRIPLITEDKKLRVVADEYIEAYSLDEIIKKGADQKR